MAEKYDAANGSSTYDVLRDESVTHLFEIICSVSYIVVKYDFEGLVHLATIEKETGRDVWPLGEICGINKARVLPPVESNVQELLGRNFENEKGYVALFPTSGLRLKVKFQWYTERHRLITGLSAHTLWEMWRDGRTLFETCCEVPKEMRIWVAKQFSTFRDAMARMEGDARDTYVEILRHQLSRTWGEDKGKRDKEIALKFQEHGDMAPLLFQMHKQREMLWKAVEPTGSETFKREDEV